MATVRKYYWPERALQILEREFGVPRSMMLDGTVKVDGSTLGDNIRVEIFKEVSAETIGELRAALWSQ